MSAFTEKKRKVMASSSATSRFADIVSVKEFIEGQENENTRRKLSRVLLCCRNF